MRLADLVAVMPVNYEIIPNNNSLAASLSDDTLLKARELIRSKRRDECSELVINLENLRVHGIQSLLSKVMGHDFDIIIMH